MQPLPRYLAPPGHLRASHKKRGDPPAPGGVRGTGAANARRLLGLALLLAGSLAATTAGADTEVAGGINVDAIWSRAESPYRLTGDVVVQVGATLTIESGVEVRAATAGGDVELIVRGALVAEGTEAAPIVFKPAEGEVPGSWEGLHFEEGSSAVLGNVQILYADYPLEFPAPSANYTIAGVRIRHHRAQAVSITGEGEITLNGLDIDGAGVNTADGIMASYATVHVNSSLLRNLDIAISMSNATGYLEQVIVADSNTGAALYVNRNPGRSLRLTRCTFYGNTRAIQGQRTDSSYSAVVSVTRSVFGLNDAVIHDNATRDYRRVTVSGFTQNVWWGPRLTSGSYGVSMPANDTSLEYNALLADPLNGDYQPTERSPARYWAPDVPTQTVGAVDYAGAPTGPGVHGFWYTSHTFPPGSDNLVEGDVVGAPGVTLTFQPASQLRFAAGQDFMQGGVDRGRVELRVEGTLEADGTLSHPVRLTSAAEEPRPGDWYGVLILQDTEAFNISQVDLGYAVRGVSLLSNDHIVAGSKIHHCSQAGIHVDSGTPGIEQVEVSDNRVGIEVLSGANVSVQQAHVHHNTTHGVTMSNASVALTDSRIHDNTQSGVRGYVSTNGNHSVRLTHCTVAHNGGDGVWVQRTDSSYGLVLGLASSSLTHNGSAGVRDGATRDYRRASFSCSGSNSWGNGSGSWANTSLPNGSSCFSYNPLYADADARNYEPTIFSPNRGMGSGGSYAGALDWDGAVGPQIMGFFWEDYTFTAAGSPYTVLGDLVATAGVTVRFEPGARLLVTPRADGMGGGRYSASRTEIQFLEGSVAQFNGAGDPIIITPDSDEPSPGDWTGLIFDDAADSLVDNAVLEYPSVGVAVNGPRAPRIEDTQVRLHGGIGLRFTNVTAAPTVDVLGAWIIGTGSGTGITFENSSGQVRSSFVTHHQTGINSYVSASPAKTVYVINNTIVHQGTGISYRRTDSSYRHTIHIANNVIANSTSYAIDDTANRDYRSSVDYVTYNSFYNTHSLSGWFDQNSNNIVSDPRIEDDDWDALPRWWDGKLWAESLAINAGNANAARVPERDIAGQDRDLAGGVDMGAFEFNPEANQEPRADAVATALMVPRGESFELDGSASVDPDGQIASAFWTMSDGTVRAGLTVQHTFAQAGENQWAYITIIDDDGAEDHARVDCNVNIRPVADAGPAVFQDEGPDEAVFFDGTLSQDSDGQIVRWEWNFGDGSPVSLQASPRHSYLSAGLYTVVLTVTDNEGLTDTDTTLATVFGNVDTFGPLIEHDEIADGAPLGQPVRVAATIRDPAGVMGGALFYRPAGGGATQFAAMAEVGGDVWEAEIPAGAVVAPGVEYWITAIDAVEPDGNTSSAPADAPASVFDFLVVGDPDPPAIAHNPIADGQAPGEPVPVVATITDATGVGEAVLFFRPMGGEAFGAANMVRAQGDTWTAQIPAFVVARPGVQYFIQATDTSPLPNRTTAPVDAPDAVFDFVVGNPDQTAPEITHVPVADGAPAGQAVTVRAELTDAGSGVASGTLLYRPLGAGAFGSVAMVRGDGNTWTAQIPPQVVVAGTLEYYLLASDQARRRAWRAAPLPGGPA